jgi:hypothetical protein
MLAQNRVVLREKWDRNYCCALLSCSFRLTFCGTDPSLSSSIDTLSVSDIVGDRQKKRDLTFQRPPISKPFKFIHFKLVRLDGRDRGGGRGKTTAAQLKVGILCRIRRLKRCIITAFPLRGIARLFSFGIRLHREISDRVILWYSEQRMEDLGWIGKG